MSIIKTLVSVGGRYRVQPEQVVMLVASINYTTLYLANGRQFTIARTIRRVQESLQPYGHFVRTSRAQVINWAYVSQRNSGELLLQNNQIIKISRRRKKEIQQTQKSFLIWF